MKTLDKLQSEVVQFRDERDWKQFHNFKDMLLSLNLEVSELCEHFQWKSEEEALQLEKQALGEELSDILYWVLLLSHDLGIDLGEAFREKMAKNKEKYPVDQSRGRKEKYTKMNPQP